jgi:hypothetical protein
MTDAWPEIPLDGWDDTYQTLQLWTQMPGKTRLALSPAQNHYWHVALYVTSRGIGTSPIPCGPRTFEVDFDFLDHRLAVRASDGKTASLPLEPRTVAEFCERYLALLRSLDVEARIRKVPCEVANPIPFLEDTTHRSYDRGAVERWFRALLRADRVLKELRGAFLGKASPVHFWWGAFDLASTRFSGRKAPRHPGGVPGLPDTVAVESYSHECASAGFWPGNRGGPVEEAAFYAYAYPEPAGFAEAELGAHGARYDATLKEWVLPYEAVRRAPDGDALLRAFTSGAYDAAARLGAWDPALQRSGK